MNMAALSDDSNLNVLFVVLCCVVLFQFVRAVAEIARGKMR